jgi:hypothetical protein
MYWWENDPTEDLFMEITRPETRRTLIGTQLEAPLLTRRGGLTASWALVPLVKPHDVIVHYNGQSEQLVGASVAVSAPEPTPTWWVARGSYARQAGATPAWLPGIPVPLDKFTNLDPPVQLQALRDRGTDDR